MVKKAVGRPRINTDKKQPFVLSLTPNQIKDYLQQVEEAGESRNSLFIKSFNLKEE